MTHHRKTEKFIAIQRSQRLCGCLDIPEHDVRLATHLHCFEGDYIEDGAVRRKDHVEGCTEIFLWYFAGGEVCDIEGLVWRH